MTKYRSRLIYIKICILYKARTPSPQHFYSLTILDDYYTLCSKKKTRDYVVGDDMNQNSPFATIFGTLVTESIGHRQVFLFSHLTYFMHLRYLGKLSRPKYL